DEQLQTLVEKIALVRGGLKVHPSAVGDGESDMALMMRVVRHPALIAQVVKPGWGLFPTVDTTLPREHRPSVARLTGGSLRLREPAIAVAEQGATEIGTAHRQDRVHEDFVPED